VSTDRQAAREKLIHGDEAARAAIQKDLSRTLFVEAGAGTGKTTALVGRIVELVLTSDATVRRPLSQIAAITFTEAAAAELRERVRIEFESALLSARENGMSKDVELCEQALADADVAAISTLHSFAQRLLSEFPVEVGVPPRV
jgi:ATP-dependent helicase/nuclease subunit A